MSVDQDQTSTQEEGSLRVHRSRSVRRVEVTTDGRNLVSHAGTALLTELADRSGLTRAMSEAMGECGISWHSHDPGVVLTHLAVAIADGADCLADFAVLREQDELFGPVASIATAWRAVQATSSLELRQIPKAVAAAREVIWNAAPPGDLVLDFDATLLDVHSDKQDAAPTYKRGFGFHPLGVWCDTTSEPLAAMLRPGNAGSNNAAHHLELLDQALSVLPPEYRGGHDVGDEPSEVIHPILVRADSAGATHDFVAGIVEANCDFSIGFSISSSVREVLFLAQEEDWTNAVEPDGSRRDGAWVVELTELLDPLGLAGGDAPHLSARAAAPRCEPHAVRLRRGTPPHLLHHQHSRQRHRRTRVPPPGTRPRRGRRAELEGLWASEPSLRRRRSQHGLDAALPRRRGAPCLGPDDRPSRRARPGRAEDDPLPPAARRRRARPARPAPRVAPRRELALGGSACHGVHPPAHDVSLKLRGRCASPVRLHLRRDNQPDRTDPWLNAPVRRSRTTECPPDRLSGDQAARPGAARMIEARYSQRVILSSWLVFVLGRAR